MPRLRRPGLGGPDTCRLRGSPDADGEACRLEHLWLAAEEKIAQHRDVCGYAAWIVYVLVVPWEECMEVESAELGVFRMRGLKCLNPPRQACNTVKLLLFDQLEDGGNEAIDSRFRLGD